MISSFTPGFCFFTTCNGLLKERSQDWAAGRVLILAERSFMTIHLITSSPRCLSFSRVSGFLHTLLLNISEDRSTGKRMGSYDDVSPLYRAPTSSICFIVSRVINSWVTLIDHQGNAPTRAKGSRKIFLAKFFKACDCVPWFFPLSPLVR
jgi:hypothetical protein